MSRCCGEGRPPRLPAEISSAPSRVKVEHARIDQRVVHDVVGRPHGVQRQHGQQARIAGAGAGQPDLARPGSRAAPGNSWERSRAAAPEAALVGGVVERAVAEVARLQHLADQDQRRALDRTSWPPRPRCVPSVARMMRSSGQLAR